MDVDEGGGDAQPEVPPQNDTPGFIKDTYVSVVVFLQSYGWFVLLGVIALLYFKNRILRAFSSLTTQRHDADHHKYDSNVALQRQEAMEASRRRLQEQMDAQAARHAEEMKKKEEEKRAQKLADWERHLEGKGYRSKYRPPEDTASGATAGEPSATSGAQKKKPPLKPADFNPLTGSGSGTCYRPPRRGGGADGGGG